MQESKLQDIINKIIRFETVDFKMSTDNLKRSFVTQFQTRIKIFNFTLASIEFEVFQTGLGIVSEQQEVRFMAVNRRFATKIAVIDKWPLDNVIITKFSSNRGIVNIIAVRIMGWIYSKQVIRIVMDNFF